jgi:hypothetical protein
MAALGELLGESSAIVTLRLRVQRLEVLCAAYVLKTWVRHRTRSS